MIPKFGENLKMQVKFYLSIYVCGPYNMEEHHSVNKRMAVGEILPDT